MSHVVLKGHAVQILCCRKNNSKKTNWQTTIMGETIKCTKTDLENIQTESENPEQNSLSKNECSSKEIENGEDGEAGKSVVLGSGSKDGNGRVAD